MPSGLYHIKLWEAIDGSRNIVYTYTDVEIDGITYGDGSTSTYSYDACGNITQVSGKENVKYSYDGLNRLVREDNVALNKSYTYSYDAGGNITAKKEYVYTTGTLGAAVKTYNYVYGSSGWKDKLTSWNGQSITYDGYGNVKSYKGATYTWDRLNRLKSCVKSNGTTEYTYNVDGQPEKTELDYGNGMVGTTEREYVNGRLYKESKILTMNGAEIVSATMQYLYRGEEVIGLIYNGSLYYYRKNLQGDIIEIVGEDGNVAATYKYDAWGNWTVSGGDVGTYNSFRYRGYYYDTAIMLYYLKTRWYDPETGRFISPDSINYLDPQSINGLNLYAYCLNNPVMYTDPDGTIPLLVIALIGAAISLAVEFISDLADDGKVNSNLTDYIGAGVAGFIGGLGGGFASSMLLSGIGDVVGGIISGDVSNFVEALGTFAVSAVLSGVNYSISKSIGKHFATKKFSQIVNGAKTNTSINLNLKIAGYGQFKIGRDGADAVISKIMTEQKIKNILDASGLLLGFITGVALNLGDIF